MFLVAHDGEGLCGLLMLFCGHARLPRRRELSLQGVAFRSSGFGLYCAYNIMWCYIWCILCF